MQSAVSRFPQSLRLVRTRRYLAATPSRKMIDILELLDEKGGNIAAVRESQKKRFANVELVDQVFEGYTAWVKGALICRIDWKRNGN